MKITFNLFFLYIIVLVFTACNSASDSTKEEKQETSETNTETEEETTNTAISDKKDKPTEDRFLELTFEGGIFDGKTMKCKVRYSSSDQSTVEEDESFTSVEFARSLNDEDDLQIDFELLWSGGLSEGKKILNTEYPSKIKVINPNKDSKYDFIHIFYTPQEVNHTITSIGEWQKRANDSAVLFEGEGKFSNCKVEKFTDLHKSTILPSVDIPFKYKARAIKY